MNVIGIRNILDRFAFPVVKWHHTIAFLLVPLIVFIIPAERKWEVYEMAFGFIFFLIFLNPLNKVCLSLRHAKSCVCTMFVF